MNIGLFTDSYYPEVSGLVTSINTLQKELKKRGHNVYIFTTSNPCTRQKGLSVFRLPSMPFIFLKSRRMGLFYSPRAAKCVKHLKLDIIHTQTEFSLGIFGNIMSKQLGIPIVHTYHTLYKDYVHYISKDKFKKFSDDLVRIISRNYCNGCNAVIAPSKKVYDLLKDYGVSRPIKIIPTGIELYRFRKENQTEADLISLKESLGIKRDEPIILFIGRIAKEKSIDVVLRQMPKVLEAIPTAKYLIVGDGQTVGELKALTRELKIENSVVFAGEQPWEKIGMFYRLGDVFVSPSVTETQGLTIIEAMASDVPVVAKNDKNIEGLINDKLNGRVFNSEDELSGILIELLSNKELSLRIVLNAQKTVEEYSSELFAQNMEAVYKEVLENRSKSIKKGYNIRKKFQISGIKKITLKRQ